MIKFTITREMLVKKLDAAICEVREARSASQRAFYTAEVERLGKMLEDHDLAAKPGHGSEVH